MENAAYIALSRQSALMRQMDIVANNIANSDTPGFKAEHMMFTEYVTRAASDIDKVSYVQDAAMSRDLAPGNLVRTGNDLDVAIHGKGYFAVQTQSGNRYTRGGQFRIGDGGVLTTAAGDPLIEKRGGTIQLPRDTGKIDISRDGTVALDGRPVGQLQVVGFANEQELRKTVSGLYTTDADPEPVERPHLVQGMIEMSNVQPIIEMTRMMDLLRSFQGVQGMLEGEHERKQRAIREIPLLKTQ